MCKVANAMKESKASPVRLISLLYLTNCKCILHGSTVEPQYKKPLYKEVLRMTIDFLYPSNSKIDEKEPRYKETSFYRTNFASPLALRYVEVPLYKLKTQFLCLLLEMGPTVLRHWSNAEERQYLHCLVVLSISTVRVIKPATSRSTVEFSCSTKKKLIKAKQPQHANCWLEIHCTYSTVHWLKLQQTCSSLY